MRKMKRWKDKIKSKGKVIDLNFHLKLMITLFVYIILVGVKEGA